MGTTRARPGAAEATRSEQHNTSLARLAARASARRSWTSRGANRRSARTSSLVRWWKLSTDRGDRATAGKETTSSATATALRRTPAGSYDVMSGPDESPALQPEPGL